RFATLIVGHGNSTTLTPLTQEQYDDLLKNGMEYADTDPLTGQLKHFYIFFLPFFVLTRHFPQSSCTPAPVFITSGQVPFLFQGCISGTLRI
ncbi:hypothetical protein ACIQ4Z_23135, partial [Peribacillus asahii]|uniref:hypothetical protein n=1 Tax=Peribacillus asahii TaxID=228899 RepID=UPI003807AAD9